MSSGVILGGVHSSHWLRRSVRDSGTAMFGSNFDLVALPFVSVLRNAINIVMTLGSLAYTLSQECSDGYFRVRT